MAEAAASFDSWTTAGRQLDDWGNENIQETQNTGMLRENVKCLVNIEGTQQCTVC